MATLLLKRGTRAQLDAAALAGTLIQGEPYLITDEVRLAIGTGANTYDETARVAELSGVAQENTLQALAATVEEIAAVTAVFTETATGLGANAAFVGPQRDAGSPPAYANFVATFFANQAGGARIELSIDSVNWRYATPVTAVAANVPVTLKAPVTARYFRVVYVNGATGVVTLLVTSAFQRV